MTTLETVQAELSAYGASRPRSQQRESGGSQTFGCRAESVLRLTGVPPSDPRLSWPALVGSALHSVLEAAAGPGVLTEHKVTYKGIVCTVDRFDPATKTLTDYKSVADAGAVAVMKRTGPKRRQLAQINLGAAGLIDAGEDVQNVELLYLPRNGNLEQSWLWSAPFDRGFADEAAGWSHTEWVRAAEAKPIVEDGNLEEAIGGLRDEPPSWCRRYCPYVTTCRGPEPKLPELDERVADIAGRYDDAKRREDEAASERGMLRGELDGLQGQAGAWRVRWSGGNTKLVEEVDDTRLRAEYEALIGELPVREVMKTTARTLRVEKAK